MITIINRPKRTSLEQQSACSEYERRETCSKRPFRNWAGNRGLETKLRTLKHSLKSIETSHIIERLRTPKPDKLLKCFTISVIFIKNRQTKQFSPHLFPNSRFMTGFNFPVVPNLIIFLKSLYGFGGRSLNIREVCRDF